MPKTGPSLSKIASRSLICLPRAKGLPYLLIFRVQRNPTLPTQAPSTPPILPMLPKCWPRAHFPACRNSPLIFISPRLSKIQTINRDGFCFFCTDAIQRISLHNFGSGQVRLIYGTRVSRKPNSPNDRSALPRVLPTGTEYALNRPTLSVMTDIRPNYQVMDWDPQNHGCAFHQSFVLAGRGSNGAVAN